MKKFFELFCWILCLQVSIHAQNFLCGSVNKSYLLSEESCYLQHISLLNEQANFEFSSKRYVESLNNYEKVVRHLEHHNLTDPSLLLNAICGSMFCYEMLDQNEFAKRAFDELVYQVGLLGEEVEEIDWYQKSCLYEELKEFSDRPNLRFQRCSMSDMTPEENCQLQCRAYAVAAAYACGRVPHPAIQFLCLGCIFGLEELCSRCCTGEGFWENCVKGLRRLFHDPEHPQNPSPHPYE